ncbi:N-acetyllactosaminide beta-1,3-N-acetylglucosaminyltransferase 2-like [Brachionichthys hirsutus]|uniref:N-acetyllactosaminide beta-1,3-N-acetylglucosaminyltransferase 2-like n=1 Tax=Brachionichthys hirsutus TaxID=412623 RepID=UPI003604639E
MAQCHCHWCNVFICLCAPCVFVALLVAYVHAMLMIGMQGKNLAIPLFVARGLLENENFSSIPETFWDTHTNKNSIWNDLQLLLDRRFNPILLPNNTKKGFDPESLLSESLSASNNMRRHVEGLPQDLHNFLSSMHRRDYTTVLQPGGQCGAGGNDAAEQVLLLLAIKSKEPNFKNRQAIRQTWGRVGRVAGERGNHSSGGEGGGYVRRIFLLGKEEHEEHEKPAFGDYGLLQMESAYHGDILQWDFKDTFFNLTLKDVLFWRWFSHTCNQTLFVFKGDDDVFVNTQKMIAYLQGQLRAPQTKESMNEFMVGEVFRSAAPHRVVDSKYYIPDSFYKGLYPLYAAGGGVLYSGLLAQRLHNVSKRVHLFPIDDVYVGMCMFWLNAQPIHHPAFLTLDFPGKEEEQQCAYHSILLVHRRSPEQVIQLWDKLKRTRKQCRDVSLRVAN